ncbi:type II toxin-antitoxin system PemK/MazF family toxin [Thermosynechococcaceae cyanobacterium BACA0444]|uniref:Type II toxin-antitoxin system PemK/MazF family toxin n=1 Tax=Pseudocalidococcus azoricus BACA0444 TaxID=2918990 RepID=A0AAE4JWS3_9CYAN|nr:type II toxin-antitoxin system PemK/MazF family toxin [Pseudocalidococcus azoricus]MDS3861705.1 type II toxin-antitoxin system PemK/MazF family toxin [Pseudocalidococcus azoricus BACA0444]
MSEMIKFLSYGDIVLVALPSNQPQGHEQEGKKPAIIVGIPKGVTRYPLILLAPLTSKIGKWALENPLMYPKLSPRVDALPQESVVLLDQIRAVDVKRVISYLGSLTSNEYELIQNGLSKIFNINGA